MRICCECTFQIYRLAIHMFMYNFFFIWKQKFDETVLSITRPNSSQGNELWFNSLLVSNVPWRISFGYIAKILWNVHLLWTYPKNVHLSGHFWLQPRSSANQRIIVQHDPDSLNVPVWFSVNFGTPLTTSIRQRLGRKAYIWKEKMLKYLQ